MHVRVAGLGILILVLLLGCVQSTTTTNGDAMSHDDTTMSDHTATGAATAVTNELSNGTGTGSNDITSDDLDSLQNDLDNLESGVDGLAESDI